MPPPRDGATPGPSNPGIASSSHNADQSVTDQGTAFASVDASDDLLDVVFGDGKGWLALGLFEGPHRDHRDMYRHHRRTQVRYRWPDEREQAMRAVEQAMTSGEPTDVYFVPALRDRGDRRRKGDGTALRCLWVELDGEPADEGLWRKLDPLIVESGTPGHLHGYLPLAEVVSLELHQRLNKALAGLLGGDHKWSDESYLRLPGTLNHKHKPPTPVVLRGGGGDVWDVASLADLLGVPLDEEPDCPTLPGSEDVTAEPLPDPLTSRVRIQLDRWRAEAPPDCSEAFYALVGAAKDDRWTPGQALTLVRQWAHTPARYADRLAEEVARCWGKAEEPAEDACDEPAEGAATGVRRVTLRSARGYAMRATDWLWEGRIPIGGLTLIGGREGDGKSTLSYTLIADTTHGRLPGDLFGTPRNVAVAATEDSWEMTIVPRLVAAGADLDRVFYVEVIEVDGTEAVLTLPRDVAETGRAFREHEVALLLLDPVMSRVDGRLDAHKDGEVRRALEPLVKLADEVRCAVVGLIHLNKSTSTDPLTAIMASRAFVAVARSVLFVMRDPDDDTRQRRLVGLAKANLATEDLPTLGFTIKSCTVGHDPVSGKEITAAALVWGEDSARSIRDAFAEASAEKRTVTTEAKEWLREYLAAKGEPTPRAEVMRAGGEAGHSERTLQRACKDLRLVVDRKGYQGGATWTLP